MCDFNKEKKINETKKILTEVQEACKIMQEDVKELVKNRIGIKEGEALCLS